MNIVICSDPTLEEMKLLICMGIVGIDLLEEVTAPRRKNLLYTTIPSAFVLQLSIISLLLRDGQRPSRANTKLSDEIVGKTVSCVDNWLHTFQFLSYPWPDFIQVLTVLNIDLAYLLHNYEKKTQ